MKRRIYSGLSAIPFFLVACAGDPGIPAGEAKPAKESEGLFFKDAVGPGRYREVVLRGSAGEARVLAREGYFEDAGPMRVSSNGTVRLHEVAIGPVSGADQPTLHDRYYCTFVSVQTGCVYARATGSICDGAWRPDGQWETTGGEFVDITMWRLTAEAVASGSEELGEQVDNSYENLLRCDPPSEDNRTDYEAIAGPRSPGRAGDG